MAGNRVEFIKPDPEAVRISDCGRFLMVRHTTSDGPRYALWHYQLLETGYQSAAEAQGAAQGAWDAYDVLGELPRLLEPQNPSNPD